ncbi:MAG: hypothetical protein GWP06_02275, partial [Actinobacteria bacterium]|nr:hypothetical protein [Actinomycetota bacterium]
RLKELLAKNGEFALPEKLLLRTEVREDITYYIFKIPTETALATKVLTLAMKSNVTGLRAFQMIMEQIDGKPHQSIALENTIKSPYESMTDEQLEAERQRLLRIKNHGK